MWQGVGSAIIGAGSSFLGNLFGASSNNSANRTNLKIAQMNNEFNERMLDKQIAYNTEMWNKQNEYNTAANQLERLEKAGFSPWTMMQGANAGSAQSAGGVNPPTATPVNVSPYNPDLSGVGNAVRGFLDYKLQREYNSAQIQQIHTDINYKNRMLMAELADKYASAKSKKARAMLDDTMRGLQPALAGSRVNLETAQAESERERKNLIISENLLKLKEFSTFDARVNAELAESAARVLNYAAMTDLTVAQTKHELEKQFKTIAETAGIKLSNNNLATMSGAIIEEANNKATRSGQAQNIWQGLYDAYAGFNNFIDSNIVKPSKKAWKDTRRSLGF